MDATLVRGGIKVHQLALYRHFLSQHLQARLAYRADFWMSSVGMLTMLASQVGFIWLVFRQVPQLNGWTLPEVLFIYGLSSASLAAAMLFSAHVTELGWWIIEGRFDRYLTRPVAPLLHVLMERINFEWIVIGAARLSILILAAAAMPVRWTPGAVALLALFFLAAVLILIAINVFFAGLAFRILQVDWLYFLYISDFYNMSYYPLTIYSRSVQLLLTWVVPLAFVSIVPAAHFAGKSLYAGLALLVPAVVGAVWGLTLVVWRTGLARYESTGS